jgi:hypothetical protein
MAVKKSFAPFMDIIESNLDARVSDIADQLRTLASTKARGNTVGNSTTFIKDSRGEVVAILDYHFKRWMPLVGPQAVAFGQKSGSSTGYNQMCKEAVADWTKRQRDAKNANADLLAKVAAGEVAPHDIAARQAEIEAARTAPTTSTLGFASKEEVISYLEAEGYEVV